MIYDICIFSKWDRWFNILINAYVAFDISQAIVTNNRKENHAVIK